MGGPANGGGMGKLGLVSDIDHNGNGYFISLDVSNGRTEITTWGFNALDNRQNYIFNNLQTGSFNTNETKSYRFRLIRYGSYIELSIDGIVKLTLIDYTYSGDGVGVFSASSVLSLQEITFSELPNPRGEYASQDEEQK